MRDRLRTNRPSQAVDDSGDVLRVQQCRHVQGLDSVDPLQSLPDLWESDVIVGELRDVWNNAVVVLDEDLVRLHEVRPHQQDTVDFVASRSDHLAHAPFSCHDVGAAEDDEGLAVLTDVAEKPGKVVEVIAIHEAIVLASTLAALHLQQACVASGLDLLVAEEVPERLAVLEHEVLGDAVSHGRDDGQEHQRREDQANDHCHTAVDFAHEEGSHVQDHQHACDQSHVQEVAGHSSPRLAEGSHHKAGIEEEVHGDHLTGGSGDQGAQDDQSVSDQEDDGIDLRTRAEAHEEEGASPDELDISCL
mmetsp:Transcript_31405/g.73634  ORF Transcript_31405/g.73634 Transcript_31405/m.73634 type:complete len:304 (+) Transcript_31405:725-1636(+)